MKNTDLVAVCGLYCGACGIYRATQTNDTAKLEEFRKGLSEKTGKQFTMDDILCDGCLTGSRLETVLV